MKRVLVLLFAVALLASACGSEDDSGNDVAALDSSTSATEAVTETTPAEELSEEESLLAFTACLRDKGVEIDDPTIDADGNIQLARPNNLTDEGFDLDAAQAALGECESLLGGIAVGFQNTDTTEFEDDLLAWAQCMRDNGYELDDPDFTEFGPGAGDGEGGPIGGAAGGPFGELDQDDPAFQSAQAACEGLLPGIAGNFGG